MPHHSRGTLKPPVSCIGNVVIDSESVVVQKTVVGGEILAIDVLR